jgi:predicted RecA/RadA family phage recombinase
MAYEEVLQSITLDADSSLGIYTGVPGTRGAPANPGGLQYRFVKITGEHRVGLSAANTDPTVGVLQNKPQATGDACTVGILGVSKVEVGAAVAAGAALMSDATGRAVTATGTNPICGYALHSAAAAGQVVPVLLRLK